MTGLIAAIFIVATMLAGPALAAAPGRVVLPDTVVPTHYDVAITPDAAHLSFTGKATIDIDVKRPTRTITLNAANLTFASVALIGTDSKPAIRFDTADDTATLRFPAPVTTGHHVLMIAYSGKINQHAAGLFALDYKTAKGTKRALYTQFENSDARHFLPCWDEPARKATFTLTATVPAGEMAVSNMPIARSMALAGGVKRVTFMTSPKMSSYLLFFALGDFERIHKKVDGVDVGVITTAGNAKKGEYALDAEAHLLPYYESYFGVKFPLPKLDLIAGPGESQFFGAMENWGAIFYFDRDLLIDPKISTEADKRGVYIVVAHETAHQWFGDLVTMAWWDDIWLNEGFAEWMQTKATAHFHPEWKLWFDAMAQKERALQIDSRAGTHPVVQPIHDVLQANEAFDTITYQKGQAVIWMIENYLGDDAFRAGVRAYIKAHEYGNTVNDDLWRAMDKVQKTPVMKIAHDFTLQSGVPLIGVTESATGIRLTQGRFSTDGSGKKDATWHVPVIEKTLGSKAEWHGLVSRDKPVFLALPKVAVPVINAGQAGYYRTLYAPSLFQRLAAHFGDLAPADQMGLIMDSRALGYAGTEPLSNLMALTTKASPGMAPMVLTELASRLEGMGWLYRGRTTQALYQAYAKHVLNPIFAKVGWEAKPGEDANVPLLRHRLLAALSMLEDKTVIAEADKHFAAYLKDKSRLSPDLRQSVLLIVAEHATPEIWDELHTLAKRATSSVERSQLYFYLGLVEDPALAKRALALALTDEVPVTVRPSIIRAVAAGYHSDMAFDFALAHLDKVNGWLEPDSRNQFEAELAASSTDAAMVPKLKAYAEAHIPPTARQPTIRAMAQIAYYAKIKRERLPEVDRWLAARRAGRHM